MTRDEIKTLLEAYRPEDADDPIFAEALREVAKDPALAAWFEESQRFDAVIGDKLRGAAAPHGLKMRILGPALPEPSSRSLRPWILPFGAAAAVAVAALLLWQQFGRVPPGRALAMQAMSFTGKMPALQFVCFNAYDVAGWINNQAAAKKLGIFLESPGETFHMKMIGSSVVDWNGHPVIMVCLQNNGQMVMLYILPSAEAALPDGVEETIERHGWAARVSRSGNQVRVLTTAGSARNLDFQVPF